VVAAYDVNPVGNDVYAHNFGLRPSGRDVRALSAAELDRHRADLWLLSPPCQPYTRQGNQLGKADGRAGSFCCLLAALQKMQHPPRRLLVENVVGFEASEMRDDLLAALPGYLVHEYVLSPAQLGVPYSRPRYFLLAALPSPGCTLATPQLEIPGRSPPGAETPPRARLLSEFLELSGGGDAALWERFAVPWAAVRSSLLAVDLVHESADEATPPRPVNCFTKNYAKYAKGTGSLLARSAADVARLFAAVELAAAEAGCGAGGLAEPGALGRLTSWPPGAPPLRYLTPLEVARLHGFPASFSFPEHVTRAQQWQLLGNSLSVDVVACLLTHLLADLEDYDTGARVHVPC
jgi:tRNA (cytosine38-C5)-methyltransferase